MKNQMFLQNTKQAFSEDNLLENKAVGCSLPRPTHPVFLNVNNYGLNKLSHFQGCLRWKWRDSKLN